MKTSTLESAQAHLELALWNAEAASIKSSDFYLWLRESGLPPEVAIRLKSLVDYTVVMAHQTVSVGKILLVKIMEFVKAHPHLAIGVAVGAAIGVLVQMVPFLGPYLAPIATVIGISVFAIAGHRLDKLEKGIVVQTGLIATAQDVIEIAMAFFKLLIDVLNVAFNAVVTPSGVSHA